MKRRTDVAPCERQDMGTTATPLYQQIYDDLKGEIKGGTYKNGDRIPSEAELSQSYGVSRITVRRAIEDLCSDGFLVKMQGRGTFVGARHISRQLSRTRDISTFTRMCQEIGARPGARVIDRQITPGRPDELEFFGMGDGTLMLLVRRVRSADGLPVCDERVILPYDWAPDLLTEPLEDTSMFGAIERAIGRRPDHHTAWTINAVKSTTEQGQLLEVSAGDPLIYSVADYVDADGKPVCIGRDYFVGGRYEIDL